MRSFLVILLLVFVWNNIAHAKTLAVQENEEWIQQQLATSSSSILKLTSHNYYKLIATPRNYSLLVMLNALAPSFPCPKCHDADFVFQTFARSWDKVKEKYEGQVKLYLAQVNFFDDGQEIFKILEETDPPTVYFFDTKGRPPSRQANINMKNLVKFAQGKLSVEIPLEKSFNWANLALLILVFVFSITFLKLFLTPIQRLVGNNRFWTSIVMVIVVLMTSGHMWNTIRGPPYAGQDNKRIQIVMPQFQAQFVIETQIMAGVYAVSALLLIGLIYYVPKIDSPTKQKITAVALLFMFVFVFSLGMLLFRMKGTGYPFSLLL